jgi:hypothetical protein
MDEEGVARGPARAVRSLRPAVVSLGTGLIAFASYAVTAARTITWWEGSSYPLAACTLGITTPPGSLLLTLIGWAASRVPLVHPVAFRLNLAAALLAAATVALVTWLSIRLATPEGRQPGGAEVAGGAVAGLAFAFSVSVWTHAVQFKPYILSAGFTALILAAALAWWRRAAEEDAPWRLFVLFLLLGLDFSVHRTNALLAPAALAWITLRRPRAWLRPGTWGAIGAGLALGLGFHLLLIPLSLRDPALDLGEPRDLARFWSYVSLQQYGGGFLFRILPRKADLLQVQLADYWQFLRWNVLPSAPWLPLTFLPCALLLLGWIVALGTATRRSLGLLVFYLCASLGAVIYFNLPAHYFRGMDRHYLPSLVILAPLPAVGAATLLRVAARAPRGLRHVLIAVLGALFVLVPLDSWRANHRACDLSRVRFAETCARDVLEPLPPQALLLTNGDNDTFPLWYLQQVEGVRTDVTVVNLPLTNRDSYVAQLRRRDPQLAELLQGRVLPGPASVREMRVALPLDAAARAMLPPTISPPDSLLIRLSGLLLGQDFVVLDLLRLAGWRRPLYVACTVSQENLAWLRPYLWLDGLAFRFVPSADPAVRDIEHLRRQLLEKMRYAGVADTTIAMDPTSRAMCGNYLFAFVHLAQAQLEDGDAKKCLATLDFAEARVPPARLGMAPDILVALRARAESRASATRGLIPQNNLPRSP